MHSIFDCDVRSLWDMFKGELALLLIGFLFQPTPPPTLLRVSSKTFFHFTNLPEGMLQKRIALINAGMQKRHICSVSYVIFHIRVSVLDVVSEYRKPG